MLEPVWPQCKKHHIKYGATVCPMCLEDSARPIPASPAGAGSTGAPCSDPAHQKLLNMLYSYIGFTDAEKVADWIFEARSLVRGPTKTSEQTDPKFPFGVADWKSDHAAMCAWLEFGNIVHNQTHGELHAQIVDRMEKLCAAIWKVRAVAAANSVYRQDVGAAGSTGGAPT